MNILATIIAAKRERLATMKGEMPLSQLKAQLAAGPKAVSRFRLRSAISAHDLAVIAEIKRRSPSKGPLRPDLIPAEIGHAYELAGAAAISVLTEQDHFGGSLDDLRAVKAATSIPILRKDFIIDEYQVYESAAAGADALLLIVAALDDESLRHLLKTTEDLGLDALVEVHTAEEFRRAVNAGATLVGVNNRNLQTFAVSLDVSYELAKLAEPGMTLVTESGIATGNDIRRLQAAGYRGFLIGETFMKADDPGGALQDLIIEVCNR